MANIFIPSPPLSGPWYIDREDCIGDSLSYINANTNYLASKIETLDTDLNTKIGNLSAAIPTPQTTVPYINSNTEINLIVDTSGSLGQTRNRLAEMFQYYLPSVLLPRYNNNISLYNQRVKKIDYSGERTFSSSGLGRIGSTSSITKVVNIMFQDEAQSAYHGTGLFNPTNSRTNGYTADITSFRTLINSYPSTYFRFLVFCITVSQDNLRRNFQDLIFSIYNGVGNYSGNFGLADKTSISKYDLSVSHNYSPSYYAELLKDNLLSL